MASQIYRRGPSIRFTTRNQNLGASPSEGSQAFSREEKRELKHLMKPFRQKGCKTWRIRFTVDRRLYDLPLKTRIYEVACQRALKLIREKEKEASGILAPKVQREVAQKTLLELLDCWLTTGVAPDVGNLSLIHI